MNRYHVIFEVESESDPRLWMKKVRISPQEHDDEVGQVVRVSNVYKVAGPLEDLPPSMQPHTREWFDECFTNPVTREPYRIPKDIRTAAERLVVSYGVRGVSDPMYFANVIAKEIGRGDGESNFK